MGSDAQLTSGGFLGANMSAGDFFLGMSGDFVDRENFFVGGGGNFSRRKCPGEVQEFTSL